MTNKTAKPQAKVTLTLRPGSLTPAQKQAKRSLWRQLITSVREDMDIEEKGKNA